jgi:tetratricopeptide (TPR) repeat protein
LLHAILLLQLLATSPQARDAEDLVHASMHDYDLKDFEKALREAEQAYRLYPLAQILYNIGQCHRALQHWERAAFFYQRYLTKLPDAPNRSHVEELLAEVEYRLKLEQVSAPPTPAPTPPPPAVQPAAPAPSAPPPVAAPPPAPPEAVATVTPEPSPPERHSHLLGIGLVIGGVVAAGVAGVGWYEVQAYLADRGVARGPSTGTYTYLFGEQQTANNWLWPAIALSALGVAGVTAGAITW